MHNRPAELVCSLVKTLAFAAVFINLCAETAEADGFSEVLLPLLEPSGVYVDKAGPEVLGQMYVFDDRSGRGLCLRPEGTATAQLMARATNRKDILVWYETRCWRYERPQRGRYREFTQFGVEWLNPRDPVAAGGRVQQLGKRMLANAGVGFEWNDSASRGLAYYTSLGFEASIPSLGAQKQVLGGGSYAEGVGLAIGIDRLMLAVGTTPVRAEV